MTNLEKIKAEILDMSAERFADAYYTNGTLCPIKFSCEACAYNNIDCGNIDCRDACIEFLNSEVPDGE